MSDQPDPLEVANHVIEGAVQLTVAEAMALAQALIAITEQADKNESDLRREWWLNHGDSFPQLYGDDGEMQCGRCLIDFKREPMETLHPMVRNLRLSQAAAERSEER